MSRRFTALFCKPTLLIVLTALLAALAVQPWELGGIETLRRLQVARSIWTSEPPVMAGDVPVVVRQFVEKNCVECHDTDTKKGELDLTALKAAMPLAA